MAIIESSLSDVGRTSTVGISTAGVTPRSWVSLLPSPSLIPHTAHTFVSGLKHFSLRPHECMICVLSHSSARLFSRRPPGEGRQLPRDGLAPPPSQHFALLSAGTAVPKEDLRREREREKLQPPSSPIPPRASRRTAMENSCLREENAMSSARCCFGCWRLSSRRRPSPI